MHRTERPLARIVLVTFVVVAVTFAGCDLLDLFANPLVGTWVFSATDYYYDEYFNYHTLYVEETLILSAEGTIEFTSSIEDRTYGGSLAMEGNGTYTIDDTYFTAQISLTRNDLGIEGDYVISGEYVLDGNRLTIYFDGQVGGANYYRL